MCKKLKVIRGSYYAWVKRKPLRESKAVKEKELIEIIRQKHTESRETYGSRRILEDLVEDGIAIGRHRVARLMSSADIAGIPKKKFKVTTDSNHAQRVSENILEQHFLTDAPDKVYVADITYIRMSTGFMYFATVIDLFSRKIVGYSLQNHMRSDLVVEAFDMALKMRNVQKGLIFHSDRGSQYTSKDFRDKLDECGAIQSMSRKGNCWDNSVAESFFSIIKRELLNRKIWKDPDILNIEIFEYINVFYNNKRRHSSNNGLSPSQFENACLLAQEMVA